MCVVWPWLRNANTYPNQYPAPNIWLGVTAENQARADERIPILLQIPAAVRFVSVEPMLGPVDLSKWIKNTITCTYCGQEFDPGDLTQVFAHEKIPHRPIKQVKYSGSKRLDALHWAICGGETGPKRRPAQIEWMRSLKNQCVVAGVPFFLKQMEIDSKLVKMPELDGQIWREIPNE